MQKYKLEWYADTAYQHKIINLLVQNLLHLYYEIWKIK